MMAQDSGQAGAPSQLSIEVTPELIEAVADTLGVYFDVGSPALRAVSCSVFQTIHCHAFSASSSDIP